jgi:hypothetical protein
VFEYGGYLFNGYGPERKTEQMGKAPLKI